MKTKPWRMIQALKYGRRFWCNGPYEFGTQSSGPVCVHGWNVAHMLTGEDVDLTQHLINCGVITLPNDRKVEQHVEEYDPDEVAR